MTVGGSAYCSNMSRAVTRATSLYQLSASTSSSSQATLGWQKICTIAHTYNLLLRTLTNGTFVATSSCVACGRADIC